MSNFYPILLVILLGYEKDLKYTFLILIHEIHYVPLLLKEIRLLYKSHYQFYQ